MAKKYYNKPQQRTPVKDIPEGQSLFGSHESMIDSILTTYIVPSMKFRGGNEVVVCCDNNGAYITERARTVESNKLADSNRWCDKSHRMSVLKDHLPEKIYSELISAAEESI